MPYIGENGELAYSNYAEQFDYLWKVLNTGYVFWDVDTTDWDAMYERYYPEFYELDKKYEQVGYVHTEELKQLYTKIVGGMVDHHMVFRVKNLHPAPDDQSTYIDIRPANLELPTRDYYFESASNENAGIQAFLQGVESQYTVEAHESCTAYAAEAGMYVTYHYILFKLPDGRKIPYLWQSSAAITPVILQNDEGAQLFAEATKKAATNGTRIGIYIDENLISNPSVGSEYASTGITGGKAWISGSFKEGIEAERLAGNINAGALRYEMEVVEQRTVGATLGANSLSRSLIAGGIGLLLVIIFMCVYYKLSGIMASVALIGYCGLFALALMMFNTNLTLAGIAGVVLSIGMAVDANVVIFERMKEELDSGKSVKAAIKGGFHRAFWAIFDSNVTTLIACGVLLALGSGTIKGFATTLLIGVVLSLFTALVVTRGLLYLGVGMGLNNPASYRSLGKKNAEKTGRFHFVNNRKVTLVILACVLVVGVIAFFVRGTNIDIDFSGGTEIQIDVGTEVTDSVCNRINEIIENEPTLGHSYVSSTSQSAASSTTAIIRTGTSALTTDQEIALENALVAEYPDTDTHNAQITTIQPTIGSALTKKAVLAVAIAVILMLAYIWFRFELNSGLAAICCLVHDLFIMLAIYSIFLIPINSNIIAAFLTILGYSINATIIVFDRIRENRTKLGDEAEFGDIVNKSVHETLGRSINTTITTLLTIGMIWIMGVDAIRNFALPLIIGIVAGLFSSVFISGMLWDRLNKLFKPRKKDGKKAAKEEKKDTAKA